jgi:hypothetical protein
MNNVSARLDLNTRMMIALLYDGIDRQRARPHLPRS